MAEQVLTQVPIVVTIAGTDNIVTKNLPIVKGHLGEYIMKVKTLTGSDIKISAAKTPIAATPLLVIDEEDLITLHGDQDLWISGNGTVKLSN